MTRERKLAGPDDIEQEKKMRQRPLLIWSLIHGESKVADPRAISSVTLSQFIRSLYLSSQYN